MPDSTEFTDRRNLLAAHLHAIDAEAFLVTALPNVRYLTGFTGSNAALLLTQTRAILFTDPRYTLQSSQETTCTVRISKGPLLKAVAAAITRHQLRTIAFERQQIPYHAFEFLHQKLPPRAKFVPTDLYIESLRMVKSPAEIELIRRAVLTNSQAFDAALHQLKPGMAESELAAEIDFQMRRLGADSPSFDTIVASGQRAALPHAHPTSNPIQPNQLLLIDMGATQQGYASDMTRTLFLGRSTRLWKQRYHAVLEAQLAAIDSIRHGVHAHAVDAVARNVLAAHKLDTAFTHSTGHGLGLEIHEPPRIGKKEKRRLRAGMVVTVEPGIYLEGEGGIRIEDTVLVTENGCEILTPTTKKLTQI